MLYKIIVSDRACQMLAGHIRFMAQTSPTAARKVKDILMSSIRSLNHLHERFPFFVADFIPPNKYHKMFVEKWYLILYQIKDKIVYADFIIDCRKDYEWLIGKKSVCSP